MDVEVEQDHLEELRDVEHLLRACRTGRPQLVVDAGIDMFANDCFQIASIDLHGDESGVEIGIAGGTGRSALHKILEAVVEFSDG